MRWQLDWGRHLDVLIAQAQATGSLPPTLAAAPELDPDLEPALDAFALLSPARAGALAAIPIGEILAYCRLVGLDDPEARETLARRLRALDAEYLDWIAAQERRRSEPPR